MIALQPPMLTGDVQTQLVQLQAWATTIVSQLQMALTNIQEEDLSESVRAKLNNPSQKTKAEIEEIKAHLERITANR